MNVAGSVTRNQSTVLANVVMIAANSWRSALATDHGIKLAAGSHGIVKDGVGQLAPFEGNEDSAIATEER